ncbi:HutD family protein [Acidisoma cellulosilytica]|uniref:HutD family protein n=1 Tax=Acidisoma cellulosilyticum TaxID=2802395 RepID=A0A963Z6S0_9PROT|nr:HutD family protein [Acidisoma cellulosilyticum]MCB8882863.1 HutD family protein [Acidisoma cellulosilyticum]
MTAWQVIRAAAFQAMPWRNGGGTTWEIARGTFPEAPNGSKGADWHWRFSLAEIASDGPFSVFPGIDRLLTVISGEGIDLKIDDAAPRRLHAGEDIAFRGEAAISCDLLDGPTRDLNLMVDRRLARILPGRDGSRLQAEAGLILLYAVEEVGLAIETHELRLAPGEAVIGNAGATADIIAGRAVWARIERLSV